LLFDGITAFKTVNDTHKTGPSIRHCVTNVVTSVTCAASFRGHSFNIRECFNLDPPNTHHVLFLVPRRM